MNLVGSEAVYRMSSQSLNTNNHDNADDSTAAVGAQPKEPPGTSIQITTSVNLN